MEWISKVAKYHSEWVKVVNTFGEYFYAEDIVQDYRDWETRKTIVTGKQIGRAHV